MKKKRHEKILELILKYAVMTQEDLLFLLEEAGFDTTQATVSRDIKELNLIKTTKGYVYSEKNSKKKFDVIFTSAVISVDYAMNDVVIKCYSGMANAACAALDMMNFPEIIGTLAGDDTIFIVTKTNEAAASLYNKLLEIK